MKIPLRKPILTDSIHALNDIRNSHQIFRFQIQLDLGYAQNSRKTSQKVRFFEADFV